MRKKFLACLLSAALVLQGCGTAGVKSTTETKADTETTTDATEAVETTKTGEFEKLSDDGLTGYIQDAVYDQVLASDLPDGAFVQNVEAIYISQEYLDELSYNSQSNVFFGYTVAELEEQFQGEKYVYTLGEDGQTTVHAFEGYDDTYDQVIRNVAVGGGVILVCVTVSVATAGVAPACSMIFAVAATEGTKAALSGAAIGAVTSGAATAISTGGDVEQALKAAAVGGSEGFKLGAIGGAIGGAATEAVGLKGASLNGLAMNEAASIQRESKYPLDVIKEFKSVEEYNVYKSAGLRSTMVGNRSALVQDIDLTQVDEKGLTNLQRMQNGKPPLDPSGNSYELHHVNQNADGTLAILSQEEHRGKGVYKILHDKLRNSTIDRTLFEAQKKQFWADYAAMLV